MPKTRPCAEPNAAVAMRSTGRAGSSSASGGEHQRQRAPYRRARAVKKPQRHLASDVPSSRAGTSPSAYFAAGRFDCAAPARWWMSAERQQQLERTGSTATAARPTPHALAPANTAPAGPAPPAARPGARPAHRSANERDRRSSVEARLRMPAAVLQRASERQRREAAARRSPHHVVGRQQHPRHHAHTLDVRPREPDDVSRARTRRPRPPAARRRRAARARGASRNVPNAGTHSFSARDQPQRPPERQHVGGPRERREDRRLHVGR